MSVVRSRTFTRICILPAILLGLAPVSAVFGQAVPVSMMPPVLITGTETVFQQATPTVRITAARMVSAQGLGVDLNVTIPQDDPSGGPWTVSFAAVVNGTSLTTGGFSLSDLLDPGDTNKDLRFDVGQDHRIIDLEYYGVPKFSANQHFTLTATLTGPGGSGAGTAEVDILLPVVLLHGWMGDSAVADFLRIIPSLMAGLADEGYTTDDTWYQTLWYQKYRSTRVSPDEVTSWLDGIVTQATGATYAERVNIVAHSLGGLVGRYYVSAGPGAEKVHKLIMIGTPNKGVSLFYLDSSRKSLEWVNRRLDSSPLLWWTIPAYPAVYQEVAGVPVHVEPPLANTFPGGTGGVACYSIYATGHLETAGGLLVTPYKDWFKVEDGGLFPGHGDGLVLAESAQLDGADNRPLASSTDHVFLPGDPAVQSHVLQCLHD